MTDYFLEERRQKILEHVRRHGRVSVNALSELFGVTGATVRTDLQALEKLNLVVRTHGGAILNTPDLSDLALAKRLEKQAAEKRRISEACVGMLKDGNTIFLDSSSTALEIARRLKGYSELLVATNSLMVAQELLGVSGVNVILSGGLLQHDTASVIGSEGISLLKRYEIKLGFFGAHGISMSAGLTDISEAEATAKRAIVPLCGEVVGILDATKWGRVGLASFVRLEQVNQIVSDANAPGAIVAQVRESGIDVVLV